MLTTHPTHDFNTAVHETHTVDPQRFSMGRWNTEQNQHIGEGDIYASYSADRIALAGKVRPPFTFRGRGRGQAWVCTGIHGGGDKLTATAYRLVPAQYFKGSAVSYAEKTADCAAARADPDGFYHGIVVRYRGAEHVLSGPPATFRPGDPPLGLFDMPEEPLP